MPYHNGSTTAPDRDSSGRPRAPRVEDRRVIAWDMEGMSLSGDDKPQHAVVFGCSAEPDKVMLGRDLTSDAMLRYIIDVGRRHPHAIHVGYGFRYDSNMLVKGMTEDQLLHLHKFGHVKYRTPEGWQWRVECIPGKMFTVTARYGRAKHSKITVRIYDFISFFQQKFLDTCEKILGDKLTQADRETIEHGKAHRGVNQWEDLPEVVHYWTREIQLMQRVFERFRDVMCQAGFSLKEWYGPGALANYIIATRRMRPHLWGAQTTGGLPEAPHEAIKGAFYGGRFELFKAGRIEGPVWGLDIGSAYPYALTHVPSLAEETGEWVHDPNPSKVHRFGFYRIRYRSPRKRLDEYAPQPLPFRDKRGLITFPVVVHGWYASPEAYMCRSIPGAEIVEGWYWRPYGAEELPWDFLREMYATRLRLGKKNLMSMPFKLGPNSLYGKLAQTVGWNKEKNLPPRSHALAIAAWVTSWCRAALFSAMQHAPGRIIAVETDGIYTTAPPDTFPLTYGNALGQWEVTQYEEMVYLQSGVYHLKANGQWMSHKARGMQRGEFTPEDAEAYLKSCMPGEIWEPMTLLTRPRFTGLGAALASAQPVQDAHCVWKAQERTIGIGSTGKRRHVPKLCPACARGIGPWDGEHPLMIVSPSDGETLSARRTLPWEKEYPPEVAELREKLAVEEDQFHG